MLCKWVIYKKLSDQGSNLDFTDPESVVLPITPSDKCGAKIEIII
jgi:hypothetical protein